MLELDKILRLRDGRKLGFGEYGNPDGEPVFFFHGTPGSRKMRHPDHGIAERMGARIITIDRPGFGLSDPLPHRTLLDWPEDVLQLADQLQINRFAVIGFSGGGPHAAACAYRYAGRITAVSLVSSLSPPEMMNPPDSLPFPLGILFRMAHRSPRRLFLAVNSMFHIMKLSFNYWYDRVAARLPECDREILLRPEIREVFRESIHEAFRQGTQAFRTELGLHVRNWGFSLNEIRVPIFLWHGLTDPFSQREAPGSSLSRMPTDSCPGRTSRVVSSLGKNSGASAPTAGRWKHIILRLFVAKQGKRRSKGC